MKMKNRIIFILILTLNLVLLKDQVSCLEYGLHANAKNSVPITKVFIIGERCSGTNYTTDLVINNFYLNKIGIGHKHFPPWYELPMKCYLGDPRYYTFEDVDDCLFIVIFRDPYDWMRSFYAKPYHADCSLKRISFSEFIRAPWRFKQNDCVMQKEFAFNSFVDKDPVDGSEFENILKLRTAKIKTMLLIRDRAPNVYYINYEIVRDYPQEVLAEISTLFNVIPTSSYKPIVYQCKGGKIKAKTYEEKTYAPISNEDLIYINSQLDPEVEGKINYTLKPADLKPTDLKPKVKLHNRDHHKKKIKKDSCA